MARFIFVPIPAKPCSPHPASSYTSALWSFATWTDQKNIRPCLQYHIKRCLGALRRGLTTDAAIPSSSGRDYSWKAARRLMSIEERCPPRPEGELYEQAASYRDLLRTLEDIEERQAYRRGLGMTPRRPRIFC
jgi:excinuclease UvrABC nuclease subunit